LSSDSTSPAAAARHDTGLLVALAMTGLTALALEVIWSRAMIPWVGGTALSQIATVAIYMGGLFLGSALAVPQLRRIADPRAAFLRIEMAAAALSLAAVFGLPFADPLFALFSRGELLGSGLGSLLRGLTGGGLMLPATILMGFSFPLAIASFDRGRGARGSAALAYGVNTLGATLGTLIGGFVLVPLLGVYHGAIAVAIADLVVLAAIAFAKAPAIEAAAPAATADSKAPPASEPDAAATWRDELPMLASILVGGMVSLGLEVILFRVLGLLLGPTARAFTVVLAVYVLGLGIGSLLARPLVEKSRRRAELVYLACWFVIGGYGLVVHAQTGRLTDLVVGATGQRAFDLTMQLVVRAGIAALVLLPITCAFGASYSAAVAAAPRASARRAGRLYAVLTLGNILGLAVAAWGILPHFRLDRGLLVVLAAAFVAPLPALSATTLSRMARVAAVLLLAAGAGIAFVLKPWPMHLLHTAAYVYDESSRGPGAGHAVVRFHKSAFETSVTVVQVGEDMFLQLDGKTTGSTNIDDQATQGRLGSLPTALHPDPKSVFVVGLGTGHTPAEALRFPVERVDCAEISPEVVLTMPLFDMLNRRCDLDRRFRMLEADGRTVLRYGASKYDVVISEPSNVWIPGVAHLFTKESFADVRSCLAPGGICAQWMQGYSLDVETLRSIVRTFLTVFPHTSLWFSGLANPDLFLIGSLEPLSIDVAALDRRLSAAGVLNVNLHHRPITAVSFLRSYVAGADALRRFAGEGPLTNDARPSLEYAAEEGMIGGASSPARRIILDLCEPPLSLVKPGPDGRIDPDLARMLTRRAEATRAFSTAVESVSTLTTLDVGAKRDLLFSLVGTYPDDEELRAALVASVAESIGDRLAAGDKSPPLFALIRRVIDVDPNHPESLKFAAMLAGVAGRGNEALAYMERFAGASEKWRTGPEIDRGRMLLQLGRKSEAIPIFARVVERSPWYLTAWRAYAEALAVTGNLAEAQKAERRIVELTADGP